MDSSKFYGNRGFTLIEVMIVVVILGILAAIVVPKIMGRPEEARVVKAKQDIRTIESLGDGHLGISERQRRETERPDRHHCL